MRKRTFRNYNRYFVFYCSYCVYHARCLVKIPNYGTNEWLTTFCKLFSVHTIHSSRLPFFPWINHRLIYIEIEYCEAEFKHCDADIHFRIGNRTDGIENVLGLFYLCMKIMRRFKDNNYSYDLFDVQHGKMNPKS